MNYKYQNIQSKAASTLLRGVALTCAAFVFFMISTGTIKAEVPNVKKQPTELVNFPGPKEIDASPLYRVTANGQDVFVYPLTVGTITDNEGNLLSDRPETTTPAPAAFCYFDFSGGPVEITVTVLSGSGHLPLNSAVVRPLRHGITVAVKEETIKFTIEKPCKLSVEPNGSIAAPLYIFSSVPEVNPPKSGDSSVTYYFGPGVHDLGVQKMPSNSTLYIAGGAVVYGQLEINGVENVKIFGRGILNASKSPRKNENPSRNQFGNFGPITRIYSSTNVTFDGIFLLDSPSWTMQITHSKEINVRNVKVVTWRENGDGIDVCSSQNARVTDCFLRTWDDALLVKGLAMDSRKGRLVWPGMSGGDNTELIKNLVFQPARNVTFSNCVVWLDRAHAMHIGLETVTPVIEDIQFQQIDIIHSLHLGVLDISNGDRAKISRISFKDIVVEDARCEVLFHIFTGYRYTTWDKQRGPIQDVSFKNISVDGQNIPPSEFSAENEAAAISNVTFENVRFNGKPILSATDLKLKIEGPVSNIQFAPNCVKN